MGARRPPHNAAAERRLVLLQATLGRLKGNVVFGDIQSAISLLVFWSHRPVVGHGSPQLEKDAISSALAITEHHALIFAGDSGYDPRLAQYLLSGGVM